MIGIYGAQCVDLIRYYEDQVLNLASEGVGNAVEYYSSYNNQPFLYNNFDRITYDGTNAPQYGDMVVWSSQVGKGARTYSNCI